mgnify:CR=1 FL=1
MKRIIASALALCLTVCLFTGLAGAAEREMILKWTTPLADTVDLIDLTHAGGSFTDPKDVLQQHALTYTPGKDVFPMVIYGSTLYGRSTMSKIASYLEQENLSLVAGVNGSFFDMSTGIPYGFVVTDGVLRTSGNVNSVGFRVGGGAVIGNPDVHVFLNGGAFDGAEIFYNKALTASNGIGLYSRDYDEKTKNAVAAYNVVLTPVPGSATELTLPGEMTLAVTKIVENTASCPIPEGGYVLSIAEKTTYTTVLANLKAFKVGDRLMINALCGDMWKGIQYACGGGDMLVEDGRALSDFTLDSKKEQRARTAVGVKPDGTVVFYTADESSNSAGMDLYDLAEMMEDLGCETALNLDGGGSTMIGVQYPGYDKCATANSPTDGSMRACANFIFLVREKTSSGSASQLLVYPRHTFALPGATVSFTAKAADRNYLAASVPASLSWSSSDGTMTDGTLKLDGTAATASTVRVSVGAGSLRAEAWVSMLPQVTEIRVYKQNSKTTIKTLGMKAEDTVQLTASASYYGQSVLSSEESFTWNVTGGVGTVTANGSFTAATVAQVTQGTIEVSYGQTVTTIPVTITPTNPFSDTKGHWAEDYINDLYFAGTLTGSADKNGKLLYRPDDSMTRQEFVVALMRYLQVDTSRFSSVTLPFADNNKIGTWALDAMKAAYSLGYMGGSKELGVLYGRPTSTITRQEAMVILARTQGLDQAGDSGSLKAFSDSSQVADWAAAPLSAMVDKGIISGSNGKLNPTGKVTRAEVAKMLWALSNQ